MRDIWRALRGPVSALVLLGMVARLLAPLPLASSSGNVSARWNGQSAVATVNGGVELLPFDELRDMRRWAYQATAFDWKFSPK